MDFHSMKRKELQSLCKNHGIPANLSNVGMADRLTQLFKEMEKAVIVEGVDGHHGNASQTESVVKRKVKKVRFSPEHELIEFTRSNVKNRRSKRTSVVNRNNGISVGDVGNGEICNKHESLKLVDGTREDLKRRNQKKNSGVSTQVVNDSELEVGDRDSSGRVMRLRRKTLVVPVTISRKRQRKGVDGMGESEQKAVENVNDEKVMDGIVNSPARVTRPKGKKTMEVSSVGEKRGKHVVKSNDGVDLANAGNGGRGVINRMSLRNRGTVDESKLDEATGENMKINRKRRQANLESGNLVEENLLRRSKRKAHVVDDSETVNDDIEKPENGKGLNKKSKLAAVDTKTVGSKGEPVGKVEDCIPIKRDCRSGRKSIMPGVGKLENNELEAGNVCRQPLRSILEERTATGVSQDGGLPEPGEIVRRSRRCKEKLDSVAGKENLNNPCPGENGINAEQGSIRRSRRNASKIELPDNSHAVNGNAIVKQKNIGRNQKRIPNSTEDVLMKNSDPSPIRRRSDRSKKAAAAIIKNSVDRKPSRRSNETKFVIALPHQDQIDNGKLLVDAMAPLPDSAESTNDQASNINVDAKYSMNDAGLMPNEMPLRQILESSTADSYGSEAAKESRKIDSQKNSGDSKKGSSAKNPEVLEAVDLSFQFKAQEQVEENISDTDKNMVVTQMSDQTEDVKADSIDDGESYKGSDVSGNAGCNETSPSADSVVLGDRTDFSDDLDDMKEADKQMEPSNDVFTEVKDISIQNKIDSNSDVESNQIFPRPHIFDLDLSESSNKSSENVDEEGAQRADEDGGLEPCDTQMNPIEPNGGSAELIHSPSADTNDVETLKNQKGKNEDNLCNSANVLDGEIITRTTQDVGATDEYSIKDFDAEGMLHDFRTKAPADDAEIEVSCLQIGTDGDKQSPHKEDSAADEDGSSVYQKGASKHGELSTFDLLGRERIVSISAQNRGSFSAGYPKDSNEPRMLNVSPVTASATMHGNCQEDSSSLQGKTWSRINNISNTQGASSFNASESIEKETYVANTVEETQETLESEMKKGTYSTVTTGGHKTFIQAVEIIKDAAPGIHIDSSTHAFDEVEDVIVQDNKASTTPVRSNQIIVHHPDGFELYELSNKSFEKVGHFATSDGPTSPTEVISGSAEGEKGYIHDIVCSDSAEVNDNRTVKNQTGKNEEDNVCNPTSVLGGEISSVATHEDMGAAGECLPEDSDEGEMPHGFSMVASSFACKENDEIELSSFQADTDGDKNLHEVDAGIDEGGFTGNQRGASDEDREFTVVDLFRSERNAEISPHNDESSSAEYRNYSAEPSMFPASLETAPAIMHTDHKEIKSGGRSCSKEEKCRSRFNVISDSQVDTATSFDMSPTIEKGAAVGNVAVDSQKTFESEMQREAVSTDKPINHGEAGTLNQADTIFNDYLLEEQIRSPFKRPIDGANSVQEETWSLDNAMSISSASNCTEIAIQAAESLSSEPDAKDGNWTEEKVCFADARELAVSMGDIIDKVVLEGQSGGKFQDLEVTENQCDNVLTEKTNFDHELSDVESERSWQDTELNNLFETPEKMVSPDGPAQISSHGAEISNRTMSKNESVFGRGIGIFTEKKQQKNGGESESESDKVRKESLVLPTTFLEVSDHASNVENEGNELKLLFATPTKINKVDEISCSGRKSGETIWEKVMTQTMSPQKVEEDGNELDNTSCLGNAFLVNAYDLNSVNSVEVVNPKTRTVSTDVRYDADRSSQMASTEKKGNKEENSLFVGNTYPDEGVMDHIHVSAENMIVAATGSPKNSNEIGEECHVVMSEMDSYSGVQTYDMSKGKIIESCEAADVSDVEIEMDKVPEENHCATVFYENSETTTKRFADVFRQPPNQKIEPVNSIGTEKNVLMDKEGKDMNLTMDHEYPSGGKAQGQGTDHLSSSHEISCEPETNSEEHMVKSLVRDILHEEAATQSSNDENQITLLKTKEAAPTSHNFGNDKGEAPVADNAWPFSASEFDLFSSLDWHIFQRDNRNDNYREKSDAQPSIFCGEVDNEQEGKNVLENSVGLNVEVFVYSQEKVSDSNDDTHTTSATPITGCHEVVKGKNATDSMKEYVVSGSVSVAFNDVNEGDRLLKTDDKDDEPSTEIDRKEQNDEMLQREHAPPTKTETIDFACNEGVAAHGELKSLKENDSYDGDSFASRKSFLSATNARTILIHGTPRKLPKASDMKENAPKDKSSLVGDFTAVRPVKRKALQNIQLK